MAKEKVGGTVQIVEALVTPVLEELGLRLWDVRFLKEGASWYLRASLQHRRRARGRLNPSATLPTPLHLHCPGPFLCHLRRVPVVHDRLEGGKRTALLP